MAPTRRATAYFLVPPCRRIYEYTLIEIKDIHTAHRTISKHSLSTLFRLSVRIHNTFHRRPLLPLHYSRAAVPPAGAPRTESAPGRLRLGSAAAPSWNCPGRRKPAPSGGNACDARQGINRPGPMTRPHPTGQKSRTKHLRVAEMGVRHGTCASGGQARTTDSGYGRPAVNCRVRRGSDPGTGLGRRWLAGAAGGKGEMRVGRWVRCPSGNQSGAGRLCSAKHRLAGCGFYTTSCKY